MSNEILTVPIGRNQEVAREACELVEQRGFTIPQAAEHLDIAESNIYRWKNSKFWKELKAEIRREANARIIVLARGALADGLSSANRDKAGRLALDVLKQTDTTFAQVDPRAKQALDQAGSDDADVLSSLTTEQLTGLLDLMDSGVDIKQLAQLSAAIDITPPDRGGDE